MKQLMMYLKDYKKESILAPLFKLLEAFFELMVPLVMANIIDYGISNRNMGYIGKMGGIVVEANYPVIILGELHFPILSSGEIKYPRVAFIIGRRGFHRFRQSPHREYLQHLPR